MTNFFLEQRLKRIERDANDDLLMIQEFGPGAYSTEELEDLLPKAEAVATQIKKMQRRLLYLAVGMSIWVASALFCAILGEHILGYIFVAFVPISLVAVIIGHRYLRRRYRSVREEEFARTIILNELARRENYWEA